MLGCSKQNVSYWELHAQSTQTKKSIIEVIHKASDFLGLTQDKQRLSQTARDYH